MHRLALLLLFMLVGCVTIQCKMNASIPTCYRDLQTTFFRQDLVAQALSLYRVDKALWHPIYRDLSRATYRVPNILQARAQAMNPNPLAPIFIPDKAFELLQDALEAVYTDVILSYRSLNRSINLTTAKGGFGYIWDKQFPRLKSCAVPPR
jgi:hypothetical protein